MKLSLYFLIFMILSSCGNYFVQKKVDADLSVSAQEDASNSFESVSNYIITQKCLTCHLQYSSYAGVVRELSSIQVAVQTNRMPKNGVLTQSQKNIFLAWIEKGAPEFSNKPAQPIMQNPLLSNWKSIYENIIATKCLVCHNPNGQAKFLDLSTRESVLKSADRIFGNGEKLLNIKNPDESYLLTILKDQEEPMPPKSSNIAQLNEDEISIIRDWIANGMPE